MTFEKDAPPPRKARVFKVDDIAVEPDTDEAIAPGGAVAPRRMPAYPRDD